MIGTDIQIIDKNTGNILSTLGSDDPNKWTPRKLKKVAKKKYSGDGVRFKKNKFKFAW
jgi:hypothetical protein